MDRFYQGYRQLNKLKEFVDWGVIIERGGKAPSFHLYFLFVSICLLTAVLIWA